MPHERMQPHVRLALDDLLDYCREWKRVSHPNVWLRTYTSNSHLMLEITGDPLEEIRKSRAWGADRLVLKAFCDGAWLPRPGERESEPGLVVNYATATREMMFAALNRDAAALPSLMHQAVREAVTEVHTPGPDGPRMAAGVDEMWQRWQAEKAVRQELDARPKAQVN